MHWRRAIREARQLVANHGWRVAAATARRHLRAKLARRHPGPEADPTPWQSTDQHAFDREHGVDTSGLIRGEALATGGRNDLWNTAYYGIGVSVFHRVLEQVPARLRAGATFIDLGCGKGRALLLAAAVTPAAGVHTPMRENQGRRRPVEAASIAALTASRFD